MKPNTITCLLFLFCAIHLLFGCSRQKAAPLPELEQAEAVMFDHPDSALCILQRMPKPTDKEQHALWCLLMTQAKCKQLLPIASDSLIRIAYNYYKSTGDARRKAMAALYMGTVNYQLHQAEEAQAFYLEATTEVEKTSDFKLGYLIMSGLGNLYLYRHLPNEAWNACQKAYSYAVKAAYKRYEMASLFYMARCCSLKKDFNKAISLYERAIELADSLNLRSFSYTIKGEIAGVYSLLKQYDKALVLEREAMGSTLRTAQSYYGMGINYLNLNRYDSAYYYLKKALNTSNIYTRKAAYLGLFHLCHQPQYQKYLLNVCDSLRLYEDSVQKIDKSKEIIAYQKKYDHQKLINKNQQLELDKANALRWLLVSVIVILFLSVLLVSFYLYRKIALHRKEEELNRLTLLLRENELQMERNRRYISELESQAVESRDAVAQLQEQKERLACLRRDNESLTAQVLERDPWLSSLRKKPVYLDKGGMRRIRTLTDRVYTDFCRRLSEAVPSLSAYDLTLCCLVKLRFPVGDIAVLSGISSSSVSTSKLRVKKKIYEVLSVTDKKSLDQWIGEF